MSRPFSVEPKKKKKIKKKREMCAAEAHNIIKSDAKCLLKVGYDRIAAAIH